MFKETCVPGNTLAKQLAFRSTQSLLSIKKDHVRRVLHVPPPDAPRDAAAIELENAVASYLRYTTQVFDLGKSVEVIKFLVPYFHFAMLLQIINLVLLENTSLF